MSRGKTNKGTKQKLNKLNYAKLLPRCLDFPTWASRSRISQRLLWHFVCVTAPFLVCRTTLLAWTKSEKGATRADVCCCAPGGCPSKEKERVAGCARVSGIGRRATNSGRAANLSSGRSQQPLPVGACERARPNNEESLAGAKHARQFAYMQLGAVVFCLTDECRLWRWNERDKKKVNYVICGRDGVCIWN